MPIFQRSYLSIGKYVISVAIIFIIIFIVVNSINERPRQDEPDLIRPVRTTKAQHKISGQSLSLTGQILAKNEIDLSFRMDGKLIKRLVSVGDTVTPGQIIACIDPQDAKDNLISARSNLTWAQATLTQATSNEARQKILLSKGVITNAKYEDAITQLQSAQAKVEGANASLNQAQNRLEYTDLRVDVAGIVTAIKAEAGEIVKAGQVVISVATNEGRDAVFNVPEQLFQDKSINRNPLSVEVSLSHDPNIKTVGIVREIAPQADPVTRTFTVKIGLTNPPSALKLGSTVTGSVTLNKGSVIELPVMSLNKSSSGPAVWVVNKEDNTVSLKNIKVIAYNQDSVIVSEGLENGEIVVTAGVHSLYPGQQVKLVENIGD